MTVVALALAAALILSVLGLSGVLRSLIRAHARERDLLINQILHVSGRTWQPPPADAPVAQAADDFEDRFTFTPAFDDDL